MRWENAYSGWLDENIDWGSVQRKRDKEVLEHLVAAEKFYLKGIDLLNRLRAVYVFDEEVNGNSLGDWTEGSVATKGGGPWHPRWGRLSLSTLRTAELKIIRRFDLRGLGNSATTRRIFDCVMRTRIIFLRPEDSVFLGAINLGLISQFRVQTGFGPVFTLLGTINNGGGGVRSNPTQKCNPGPGQASAGLTENATRLTPLPRLRLRRWLQSTPTLKWKTERK